MAHTLIPAVLRYVDQVARSGSIQGAAKELNIAASAINRQILQLEDDFGIVMFERLPRGMRLTAPGEALVAMTRRWRSEEQRTVAQIRSLVGIHQGHVRLMAMDSHSTSFLPALVESLAQSDPLISLSIDLASTDEAAAELLGGRADLIVAFNLPPRREFLVLWQEKLPFGCVVAPGHALAQQASVSLQEATAHPVALQSRSLAIRRFLEAQYGWLFAEARGRFETNSLQLVKRLATSGRYVAITSELDAAPELQAGTLRFIPVRDKGAEPQTISIAVASQRPQTSVVKRVADRLAQTVQACLDAVRTARGAH